MSDGLDDDFMAEFERDLAEDNSDAADQHLAAGRSISYREADTPAGMVIREYPGGRRELLRFDPDGECRLVSVLQGGEATA